VFASSFLASIKKFSTRFVLIGSLLSLLSLFVAVQPAAADDGPWFKLAVGSCDAPEVTSEITAGDTLLVVSGGLMSSSPFEFTIAARTTDVSQPYINLDRTVTADSNGQVCAEAFITSQDDFGQYDINVHALRANQRSYNTFTILTINPAPVATATPEATDTPTPDPTNTPEPTVTSTPEPTEPPTAEPTNTPEPTATPTVESTVTSTPEATNTPGPTSTASPEPTNIPGQVATTEPQPSPIPNNSPQSAENPVQSGDSNPSSKQDDPQLNINANVSSATTTQNSPKVQSIATVNLRNNVKNRVVKSDAQVTARIDRSNQADSVHLASPVRHASNRVPLKSSHNFIPKSESFIHLPVEAPQEVTSVLVSIIWIAALGALVTTSALLVVRARHRSF